MLPPSSTLPLVHSLPWVGVLALPLLLALAVLHPRWRSVAMRLAPWSALPPLSLGLLAGPDHVVEVPWILLGMRLGVDATGYVFLVFTAVLWTCAGVYARAYLAEDAAAHRFVAFALVTMSGNLGLILAQDVVSFYLFFALMSFAAYGLVVHDGSREAQDAGRVYLGLVVVGEVLLVSALFCIVAAHGDVSLQGVAASVAGAEWSDLMVGLTLAGFGIKVGALPLHVWLPLAHPVAPTPASAVLSGAMIKAGLLGWLRFLPLGEATLAGWGSLCIAAGLLAAFYGVAVGLTQDHPKTVLAYSSISQMGFMTLCVGVGLAVPEAWPPALAAVLIYALHHGLAKGALFLGVGVAQAAGGGVWQRGLVAVGLLLPALALAGAPLTSGAVAKYALKAATALAPALWEPWFAVLLPLAAVGTTLVMGRFLILVWPSTQAAHGHLVPGLWVPWATLLGGVAVTSGLFDSASIVQAALRTLSSAALWPVVVGALLLAVGWRWGYILGSRTGLSIPAGDLLVLADWLKNRLQQHGQTQIVPVLTRWRAHLVSAWHGWQLWSWLPMMLARSERRLGRWTSTGVLFLALTAMLFILLAVA